MEEFFELVKTLRKECPWDRKQTLKSLIPQLIEEIYELSTAIQEDNLKDIEEELGDVLLCIFMMGTILEEKKINFSEVVKRVQKKMIARHPHVFGKDEVKSAAEVVKKWEERKGKGWSVQRSLPALLRSSKIQEAASRKGFDWKDISGVYEKIKEELEELKIAENARGKMEEFGDILFSCAHLGNFLNINPEIALQKANDKFEKRFKQLENSLKGKDIKDFSIDELEKLWQNTKNKEI
ncbi:MAG: nucleoside triphosphate pyrophosphohydrolase [candidate division WOR-3 bacterium]|nr:nucleoside triphosphate pyrophosphohydrolase [candidate division WOR-3 bacterium]